MIPLTNPLFLQFPCLLFKAEGVIKIEGYIVTIGNTLINTKNPTKSSSIKGTTLFSLSDLFRSAKAGSFILDYKTKVLYKLGKSLTIIESVRKIKCITDDLFYCQGFSFPIYHDIKNKELHDNSISLYVKIGIWENCPIFMELVNGHKNKRKRRI